MLRHKSVGRWAVGGGHWAFGVWCSVFGVRCSVFGVRSSGKQLLLSFVHRSFSEGVFFRLLIAHSSFDISHVDKQGLSDIETERLRDCAWFEVWILDIM